MRGGPSVSKPTLWKLDLLSRKRRGDFANLIILLSRENYASWLATPHSPLSQWSRPRSRPCSSRTQSWRAALRAWERFANAKLSPPIQPNSYPPESCPRIRLATGRLVTATPARTNSSLPLRPGGRASKATQCAGVPRPRSKDRGLFLSSSDVDARLDFAIVGESRRQAQHRTASQPLCSATAPKRASGRC